MFPYSISAIVLHFSRITCAGENYLSVKLRANI